jgi:hypothetical protein
VAHKIWNHCRDMPQDPAEDDEVLVVLRRTTPAWARPWLCIMRYTLSGWGDIGGNGWDWDDVEKWAYPSVVAELQ